MSQEAVPQQGVPEQPVPDQPKGLLQQMEELMAALNADLSQLDAHFQSSGAQGVSADGSDSASASA